MENLWRGTYEYKYAYEPCSSSAAAYLPPYYHATIDTNEGIQIQTPAKSMKFVEPGSFIDDDPPEAVIFEGLSIKTPHDYGLVGAASLGPVVQVGHSAEDDSSSAVTQCWQNVVANIGFPAQTLACNSPVYSLLSSSNPIFPPTRGHRKKKAEAEGGGPDHDASREYVGNGQIHKLVERQRRSKMKALYSTLISLTP